MEIKDRIKLIMDNENMLSGAFAESIGVQQSTLSHILNGRNKPSLDVVMKVHQKHPHINLEWLLYGKGEMRGNSDSSSLPVNDSFPSTLFDQNLKKPTVDTDYPKKPQENAVETPVNPPKETVIQEIKYVERPPRKISEIRIFFDDNTYEIFKGEK